MRIKSIISALLFSLPFLLFSQNENVRPPNIGEECIMSESWYQASAEKWEFIVTTDPKDAKAWLNYYKAVRFGLIAGGSQTTNSALLDDIVETMGKSLPESFEYHYISFWNSRDDAAAFHHLEEAYRIDPNRKEIYDDFMWWYEMNGNIAKRNEFARRWKAKGAFSPAVMEMNQNILLGANQGSLIITSGFVDTYSLWIQLSQLRSQTHHVVNLQMLMDPAFRARRFKAIGFVDPFPGLVVSTQGKLLESIMTANPGKELHITLNHSQAVLSSLSSRLYLTGLTLRMSQKPLSNMSILENNWSRFKLDELKACCDQHGRRLADPVLAGYLMPMTILGERRLAEGKKKESKELSDLASRLAQATGKHRQLKRSIERRE